MLGDDFLYTVDFELNKLRDSLLDHIMGKYADNYYEIQMPLWFCEGGLSEEISISKETFETFYNNCLYGYKGSDNIEDTVGKALTFFLKKHKRNTKKNFQDLFLRLYAYQNAYQAVSFLQNILYEQHFIVSSIEAQYYEKGIGWNSKFSEKTRVLCYRGCLDIIPLKILINSFFSTASSMLEYFAKTKGYFSKNYKNVRNMSWSRCEDIPETLFDKGNPCIKKLRSVRNMQIHEGSLYLDVSIYSEMGINFKSDFFLLFPDFDSENRISHTHQRHLFYSQKNDPLTVIHEIYNEIQRLFIPTINALINSSHQ